MKMNKKTISMISFIAISLTMFVLFQNFNSIPPDSNISDLRAPYLKSLGTALDIWEAEDISLYSTGHICKSTSVSLSVNPAQEGKPYITPKIHKLAALLKNLGSIYPYVDQKRKDQILSISTKIYFYLYRQIDWEQSLIKDDYGLCYKGLAKVYSFLSTPETVIGLHAFYKILDPSDPKYLKLKTVIGNLALAHLNSADGWITKIGVPVTNGSANFMALNLSVLEVLNDVDPKNSYFQLLKHRMITDYAWIRSTWINSSKDQLCGKPLLFGGWSHQTPQEVSRANNFELDCRYFDQSNSEPFASVLRSYYLQKISYHSIITQGLLNIRDVLKTRNQCSIVKYGSQGTCTELDVILHASASWTLEMMKDDGSIPTAFKSYQENEFGYFQDNAGNRPGIKSVMKVVATLFPDKTASTIIYKLGFPDSGEVGARVTLSHYKTKIYKLLNYEVNRSRTVIELGDAFFLAEEKFKTMPF